MDKGTKKGFGHLKNLIFLSFIFSLFAAIGFLRLGASKDLLFIATYLRSLIGKNQDLKTHEKEAPIVEAILPVISEISAEQVIEEAVKPPPPTPVVAKEIKKESQVVERVRKFILIGPEEPLENEVAEYEKEAEEPKRSFVLHGPEKPLKSLIGLEKKKEQSRPKLREAVLNRGVRPAKEKIVSTVTKKINERKKHTDTVRSLANRREPIEAGLKKSAEPRPVVKAEIPPEPKVQNKPANEPIAQKELEKAPDIAKEPEREPIVVKEPEVVADETKIELVVPKESEKLPVVQKEPEVIKRALERASEPIQVDEIAAVPPVEQKNEPQIDAADLMSLSALYRFMMEAYVEVPKKQVEPIVVKEAEPAGIEEKPSEAIAVKEPEVVQIEEEISEPIAVIQPPSQIEEKPTKGISTDFLLGWDLPSWLHKKEKPAEKPAAPADAYDPYPWPKRITVRHVVGDQEKECIPFATNYTSLEIFAAPDYRPGHMYPFIDLRGHRFDNNTYSANAGVGGRYVPSINSGFCEMLGFSVYYDYRQGCVGYYQQIGAGIEVLGRRWDFRANAYAPFGARRHIKSCFFNDYDGDYFARRTDIESVSYSFNGEVGYLAINGKNFSFYMAAGPYFLARGRCCTSTVGGEARIRPKYKDYVALDLSARYDDLFGTIWQASIIFNLPLYQISNRNKRPCGLRDWQIYQSVERFEVMPLSKRSCWETNF